MPSAAADEIFRLKRVVYRGKEVPVLMQNENGPCPLLAISNVLLLRGAIFIHPDLPQVAFSELSALLADHLLSTNTLSDANAELRANMQQNIADGIALFPKLLTGLDVNVRFNAVDALEYTEDLVIFDLFNVRLLHGWLLDPQDTETAAVVGSLSYNTLVERVIGLNALQAEEEASTTAPAAAGTAAPSPPHQAMRAVSVSPVVLGEATPAKRPCHPAGASADPFPVAPPPVGGAEVDSPMETDEAAELEAALALSCEPQPVPMSPAGAGPEPGLPSVAPTAARPPSPPPSPPPPPTEEEDAELQQALALSLTAQPPPASPASAGPAPPAAAGAPSSSLSAADKARIRRDGTTARDWLERSSSQLTYYGLDQLHECTTAHEPCVFFRNNHFSTLVHVDNELYLLATDLGYLHERDIVWERLNQIDGDSVLCDGEFRLLDLQARAAEQAAAAAREAEAAAAAAEAAAQQQPSATGGAEGAAHGAGGGGEGDLALALALQREEEEEASRRAAAPPPVEAAAHMPPQTGAYDAAGGLTEPSPSEYNPEFLRQQELVLQQYAQQQQQQQQQQQHGQPPPYSQQAPQSVAPAAAGGASGGGAAQGGQSQTAASRQAELDAAAQRSRNQGKDCSVM